MDEGIAALLGAIVGGLITSGATVLHESRKAAGQAKSLAIAVAGEAAAIAEVVRRRQWLDQIADFHREAKEGAVYAVSVQLPPQILAVARGAQASAGTLPGRLPVLVPRLVLLGDAVAADLDRLYRYQIDDPQGFIRSDHPAGAAEVYAELFAVLASALRACDEIIAEVKRLYPTRATTLSSQRSSIEIEAFPNGNP